MMLSALRKLTRFTPSNVVAKKRAIAQNVMKAETYIV
jgi:hypothetical protein